MQGGLITGGEVEQIANDIAKRIVENHTGKTVLLIEILEGALSFSRRVVKSINKHDPQLNYTLTSIKIRSYENGSRAGSHRIDRPLVDEQHREIRTLSKFDTVIVLDDLIDSGGTYAWLVQEYLPDLNPGKITACFMLEKIRPRSPEVEEALDDNVLIGVQVPDVWVVGYGPDITLPGTAELPPLHLCRGELPGGVYGFNSNIEQQLIAAYHADPTAITEQLRNYITER
jgi:hypoxanthine phosphoribosyltransferase